MSFGSSTDASMKPACTLESAIGAASPANAPPYPCSSGPALPPSPLFARFIGHEQAPAAQAEPAF